MRKTTLDDWIAAKVTACLPDTHPTRREALAAYQLHKLRETLAHAQNGPFWRRKLASIAPEDIRTPADLAGLPLTTPEELAAGGSGMVCVSQREISRIVTLQTSGTTGPPKRIHFTGEDQALTRDFFHHGISNLVDPGDRVLILLPFKTPGSIGDLLIEALPRIPATPRPFGVITDENAREAEEIIRSEKINAVVGIPHQLLRLAEGQLAPLIRAGGSLKTVLYATDYVPLPLAGRIERAWGCAGFEHYGMTEMGLGGGVTCEAKTGYHLREADLLFEVVDPLTGRPLPDGQEGELVFTTLTRWGMPLIRYRTGDRGAFHTEACPCGSFLRTLRKVSGRAGQALPLPGGTRLPLAALDDRLFAVPGLLDYEPALRRADGGDIFTLRYTGGAAPEQLRAALAQTPLAPLLASGALGLELQPGFQRARDEKAIQKRKIGEEHE